jgi:hypothetical protein
VANSMPTAGAPPGVYPGHVSSIQERDFARDPERILSVPAYWGLEGDAPALLHHPTVQVRPASRAPFVTCRESTSDSVSWQLMTAHASSRGSASVVEGVVARASVQAQHVETRERVREEVARPPETQAEYRQRTARELAHINSKIASRSSRASIDQDAFRKMQRQFDHHTVKECWRR